MGEVGHAVARQGLTLVAANALVLALLQKYEHVFDLPGGNPGAAFDLAYELPGLVPAPAWVQMYEEVKADLRSLGLAV